MSDTVLDAIRAEYRERYREVRRDPVELGRVRDFLLALDEPADIGPGDHVPPLFLLTLGRVRRPVSGRWSAMKLGDEYAFDAPVCIGDVVTVECEVPPVTRKTGSRGEMFVVHIDCRYTNQHGVVVGTSRKTSVLFPK